MKKLRITVNGKVYDCVVEVLDDDERRAPLMRPSSPLPPVDESKPASSPPAASAASDVPAPPKGNGHGNGINGHRARNDIDAVVSPLGGTVQKIFVQTGALVEAKAPLVLLDAMKMDTYIYAHRTAKIAEVCVAAGDTVQVGQTLVRYASE